MISAWTVLVTIPSAVVFAVALGDTWRDPAARDMVIFAGVLALVAIIAVTAVVRQTFAVALYRYATTWSAERPFEQRDQQSAVQPQARPVPLIFRALRVTAGQGGPAHAAPGYPVHSRG